MSQWKTAEEYATAIDRILGDEATDPMPLPERTDQENVAFRLGVEHARCLVRDAIEDRACLVCERRMSRHGTSGCDEECPNGFVDSYLPGED
jgi:hypothetical protein